MRYLPLILVLVFFVAIGCLESSPYKQVSPSDLIAGSDVFEADSANLILSIFTEQDIYHSNETLKVHLDFNSPDDGRGQIQVSGIRNAFGRASINETRDVSIKKGSNGFDFEFTTPSCEECSALAPGVYSINATVNIGGKTFETYKKITLEREGSNVSEAQAGVNTTRNALTYNYTQTANVVTDRKSTRLNSSHNSESRMPSSA
jgi:hypothetical protein